MRSGARKRVVNLRRQTTMKKLLQSAKKTATNLKPADRQALLNSCYQAIDKAAKTGVIKPNTAARKKSQVARLLRQKSSS